MNCVVAVADAIAPMLLCKLRAVGLAGAGVAVLIGLVQARLARVTPSYPHAAGVWLTQASGQPRVQAALGALLFRGIFLRSLVGAVHT